jgi:excisionase family DNA binding protein
VETSSRVDTADTLTGYTMSVSSAADALGSSRSAIYRLIHRGRLPHARKGRRILIDGGAIAERASANRTASARPDKATIDADRSGESQPAVSSGHTKGSGQRELTVRSPRAPFLAVFFF